MLEKLNLRMEYKIGTDARCAVIGYGSWATAIVGLLAANGRRVGWYVRNPEVLESLCSDGRNPRYLNDLEFDRKTGTITALIVPGPGKFCFFPGRESEYIIPWCCICQIGDDIILVEVKEEKCFHKDHLL